MTCARVTRVLFSAMSAFGLAAQALRAQSTQEPQATPRHQPTAAELSHNETVGTALMRTFGNQEYEFGSAAEATPSDKYNFRPAVQGKFTETAPLGPTELVRIANTLVRRVAAESSALARRRVDGVHGGLDVGRVQARRY